MRSASWLQLVGLLGISAAVASWSWRAGALVASLICVVVGVALESD